MNIRFLTTNVCLWTRKLGREEFGLYLEPKLMLGVDVFRVPDHMTVWFTIGCLTLEWIHWEANIWDDSVYANLDPAANKRDEIRRLAREFFVAEWAAIEHKVCRHGKPYDHTILERSLAAFGELRDAVFTQQELYQRTAEANARSDEDCIVCQAVEERLTAELNKDNES